MTAGGVGSILAAANTPFVTTTAGAAAAACFPALQEAFVSGAITWSTVRLVNLAAYSLSYYASLQPGRLDGVNSANVADNNKELTEALSERETTLFVPAGYAFVIWAPIFGGELLSVVGSFLLSQGSTVANILQRASAGFVLCQVFQTLWTATFRPKYIQPTTTGLSSWISAGMLTGIAAFISRAHAAIVDGTNSRSETASVSLGSYLLYFLPISLHYGWTSAAALVNWNGNIAMVCDSEKVVAGVAWASTVAATALGVAVTLTQNAPVYGSVIAWALAACAVSMHQRVQERDTIIQANSLSWMRKRTAAEIKNAKGYYGATVQKWLCVTGAILSGGATVFSLLTVQPSSTSDTAP